MIMVAMAGSTKFGNGVARKGARTLRREEKVKRLKQDLQVK